MTKFYFCTLILLLGSFGFAALDDDLAASVSSSVYSLQSTCASSGAFTAKALEHTRKIKTHLEALKNNVACKGLSETMGAAINSLGENLSSLEADRQTIEDNSKKTGDFNPTGQMTALRTFAKNMPVMRGPVVAQLMRSALQSQRLDAVSNGVPDVEGNTQKAMSVGQASAILEAKKRMALAAKMGVNMINSTIDGFSQNYKDCLDQSPVTAGFMISGLTQMLASFSSASDTALSSTAAAQALQKVVGFMGRDKKYIDSIRKLNETEFYTTLSCLIEMTNEGYCAVEDAQLLLNEVRKDYNIVERTLEPTTEQKKLGAQPMKVVEADVTNFQKLLSHGPMAGQYILTHQLPLVTDWINKIQFGVDPQLPTEAKFQIDTFNTGLTPFIRWKQTLGTYNNKLAQLQKTSGFQAKQNLVLEMLTLVNDNFTMREGQEENFFIRVHSVPRMPFALLGMKDSEMPKEVFEALNNQVMDPIQYLTINFQKPEKLPMFADPDALAVKILNNARSIFERADFYAQQYFLQFFIPDEVAVVTESMVGMNKGDVRSALKQIDIYLKDFIERIGTANSGDAQFVIMATDIRKRFGHIFARYQEMHEYGMQLLNMKESGEETSKSLQEKMTPMARAFIEDVYDQFNVKKMRAGWLQYRLLQIVRKDYSIAMQQRTFSEKALQDLLLATGLESLNQLFGQAGINFATADMDMAQARSIYWDNIRALENIAMTPMQNYINKHRVIADPNIRSQHDLWKEANRFSYNRYAETTPIDNPRYAWWRKLKGAANNLAEGLFGGLGVINPNTQYGWPEGFQEIFNTKRPDLTEGQNGDSQKIWARNCSVVLSFYDLSPYWYICKASTLYSPFYDEQRYGQNSSLSTFLKNELSTQFVKSAYAGLDPQEKDPSKEKINLNRRARICALRDYYRRNYVLQITAGLQRNNEVYTNEFTKIADRPGVSEPIVEPPKSGTGIPQFQDPPRPVQDPKLPKMKKGTENKKTDKKP